MDYNYRIRHEDRRWFKEEFKTVMGMWCEDVHKLQRWERSRMMKRHRDLKVGINLIGDAVDIV
jgi:hypothetical protein